MPSTPFAVLEQAERLSRRGDLDGARRLLAEALHESPGAPAIHEELYRLSLLAGDPVGALNVCLAMRRLDPESNSYLHLTGMAALAAGLLKEAQRLLEEALARAPESCEVRHTLARVVELKGDEEAARRLLEEAVALDDAAPGPAIDLARLYLLRRNGADNARRVLERVLEVAPDDPRAHLNMALALTSHGEYAAAARHAHRAAADGDPHVRAEAERILERLKRPRGAKRQPRDS